jgi:multidrug efflux pump subunit AcrA (membrane-fusion protein)
MATKDDLAKAEAALARGVASYTFEGKTYDLTGLRKLVETLKNRAKTEAKQAKEKQEQDKQRAEQRTLNAAQQNVKKAQEDFDDAVRRFNKRTVTQSVVDAARAKLKAAQEELRIAQRTLPTTPQPATTTKPTVAPTKPGTAPTKPGTVITKPADTPKPDTKKPEDTTKKKPEEDIPKKKPEATTKNILDELAARFPAYRDWTLDQATAYFGADLIKVFTDAANGVYGVGAEFNQEAITRAIEGTNYWRNTQAAIRNWDALAQVDRDRRVSDRKLQLASTFGELQLDDATLTDLSTIAERTGLKDLGLRQLVFGAAFKDTGRPGGVSPRKLALESSEADALRRIAKAYGFRSSDLDAQIESVLTGNMYAPTGTVLTTESFRQKAEQLARGAFPHLKDQFDSGLTLNDIFGNYQQIAARVLELDPSEVDYMRDEKWFDAFGSQKDGLPTLSSWVTKLKSEPKYGWRFTNQANQQVSSVASTLERAFGLIK